MEGLVKEAMILLAKIGCGPFSERCANEQKLKEIARTIAGEKGFTEVEVMTMLQETHRRLNRMNAKDFDPRKFPTMPKD